MEVVRTGDKELRRSSKERQAAYVILDEIFARMADEDPKVIEKAIKEAVKEAGKQ